MTLTRRQFTGAMGSAGAFTIATAAAIGQPQASRTSNRGGQAEGPPAELTKLASDEIPIGVLLIRCDKENNKDCYISDGFGNRGGGRFKIRASIVQDGTVIKKPVIAIVNDCSFKITVSFDHGMKDMFKKKKFDIEKGATELAKIKDKTAMGGDFPAHDDDDWGTRVWFPKMHVYKNGAGLGQCKNNLSEHSTVVIEC